MGRRALRKIDPSLDLSSYLFELDELQPPLDVAQLFGRSAPLEIEVGSGKGLFLQTATRALPERDFLGIEVSRKYARFSAARLARHAVQNGKMIRGDALRLFREYLEDASADAVHVYFPDPWWKKRHHKRRVMQPEFLHDVERVLRLDGRLHFWTDVQEYFVATGELIHAETSLVGPLPINERPAADDLDYQTHFERRMRLKELPVHRAEFKKQSVVIRR